MIAVVLGFVVYALAAYTVLGLLAAIPLHARGLVAVDPGVHGAGLRFRILITPGVVALWPVLIRRWLTGAPPPGPWSGGVRPLRLRRLHGLLIKLLAVAIPILCGAALIAREAGPSTALESPAVHAQDASEGVR